MIAVLLRCSAGQMQVKNNLEVIMQITDHVTRGDHNAVVLAASILHTLSGTPNYQSNIKWLLKNFWCINMRLE